MPRAYSQDLRERVIAAVVGGPSRHAAAKHFQLSASSAICWLQRWQMTGEVAAKPTGGSTSPLQEYEAERLALAKETRPDTGRVLRRTGQAQDRDQPSFAPSFFCAAPIEL